MTDGIGLDNGIARLGILISAAGTAITLLKTGDLEERLAALESAMAHRESATDVDDPRAVA